MKQTIQAIISLIVIVSGCSKQPKNEYVASPDFSVAGFSQIQTGMTLHEVLDVLGVPLSVFGPIQGTNEYRLEYTGPSSMSLTRKSDDKDEYIKYRSFGVRFDASNHVMELHSNEAMCKYYQGIKDSIFANINYRRQVGKLTLQSLNGDFKVLDSNDPNLSIIIFTRGGCKGDSCSITSGGPSWLNSSTQDLLDSGTVKGKYYLYVGDQLDTLADSLQLLDSSETSEFYVKIEPAIELTTRDRDSGILLYKSGTVHSVPPIHFAPDKDNQPVPYEVQIEIQKWLINKLGRK